MPYNDSLIMVFKKYLGVNFTEIKANLNSQKVISFISEGNLLCWFGGQGSVNKTAQ